MIAPRSQGGFSLIEVLLAVAIFSIVSLSILTGVTVVVRADATQQAQSAVALAARNYSAALSEAAYAGCGTPQDYSPTIIGLEDPKNATVKVTSVRYWNGKALPETANPPAAQWNASFDKSCGAVSDPDAGLQRITYEVSSTIGGRNAVRTAGALKRFNGAHPEPQLDPPPGGNSCVISAAGDVDSTWVNETAWERDTNYSSGPAAGQMNILYLAGTRRYSYLRFNVAPNVACDNGGKLPTGANLLAAELSLYTFNIGGLPACGAGSCWHVMERVRSNWDESTLTWNKQPCPTGYGESCQQGGAASTILFEHGTGAFNWSARFQHVESTQLLNDVKAFYASPKSNYGWVIKEACVIPYGKACGSISPGFQMRSSRGSDQTQRPTLTVFY